MRIRYAPLGWLLKHAKASNPRGNIMGVWEVKAYGLRSGTNELGWYLDASGPSQHLHGLSSQAPGGGDRSAQPDHVNGPGGRKREG